MTDWDDDYGGIFSSSIFGGRDKFLPAWDSTEAISALEDSGDHELGWDRTARRLGALWPEKTCEMEAEAFGPKTLADFLDGYEGPGLEWTLYRVPGYKRSLPSARPGFVERDWLDHGPVHREGYRDRLTTEKEIAKRFGGGEYLVVVEGSDKRPRGRIRVHVDGEPLATENPWRQAVPSAVFSLPLRELSAMLLSACDQVSGKPPPPDTVRAVVDGWLSNVSLVDSRLDGPGVPGLDAFAAEVLSDYGRLMSPEERLSTQRWRWQHAQDRHWSAPAGWRTRLPAFQLMTDSEIFRAFVNDGTIADRAMTRDGIMAGISAARVLCEKESTRNAERVKREQGTWYLWLDDERDPRVVLAPDNGEACLGTRYAQYVENGLLDVDWRWAKSVDHAIRMVEEYGLPNTMALDHDLGCDAKRPDERYDAVRFLRWLFENGYGVPRWYVHSANPVGRENIESYMRSWEKSLGIPDPTYKAGDYCAQILAQVVATSASSTVDLKRLACLTGMDDADDDADAGEPDDTADQHDESYADELTREADNESEA
jgi:hypothetical protein